MEKHSDHAGAITMPPPHVFPLRVYYEDTDLAGIVYYANYLKFIERARSEWVRAQGVDQVRLRAENGLVFVVRRVEADYLRPAFFDDTLHVVTTVVGVGGARIVLDQEVWRGDDKIFAAGVVLVCVGPAMGATRIPPEIRAALLKGGQTAG
jgi:acyl-CoA thioester hydrolase